MLDMLYHAIVISNKSLDDSYAVIRPAIEGITDTEWEHKCRSYDAPIKNVEMLKRIVGFKYQILGMDGWNALIQSLDDPSSLDNDRFIATSIPPCHRRKE